MSDLDAVGQTALGVAYVRAVESRRPDALFEDPLAAAMFDESQTSVADPTGGSTTISDPASAERLAMYKWIVGRTVFLDDVCIGAYEDGIRQFVILGAGLDARPFRLDLGASSVVFELDTPGVIDVRKRLVADLDLETETVRRTVSADLAGPGCRR